MPRSESGGLPVYTSQPCVLGVDQPIVCVGESRLHVAMI